MTEQAEIRPPFRIMPSREPNFRSPGELALIGVALVVGSIWIDSSIAAVGLFIGIFLMPIGLLWLWKERKYFDRQNAYWIEIGGDEFALVTPDGTNRSKWTELTPFEVKRTEHEGKHGQTVLVTFETVVECGGAEVSIPLDDFATRLGKDSGERAEAMRAILEDLRQRAARWQNAEAAQLFPVPTGLVVASMPSHKRSVFAAVRSVVQRQ